MQGRMKENLKQKERDKFIVFSWRKRERTLQKENGDST